MLIVGEEEEKNGISIRRHGQEGKATLPLQLKNLLL
jgi:hypothetical protein